MTEFKSVKTQIDSIRFLEKTVGVFHNEPDLAEGFVTYNGVNVRHPWMELDGEKIENIAELIARAKKEGRGLLDAVGGDARRLGDFILTYLDAGTLSREHGKGAVTCEGHHLIIHASAFVEEPALRHLVWRVTVNVETGAVEREEAR